MVSLVCVLHLLKCYRALKGWLKPPFLIGFSRHFRQNSSSLSSTEPPDYFHNDIYHGTRSAST